MPPRHGRSMWTIEDFDIIYRKKRRREEDMARILRAMFGGMFLERDPFDVGPGDSYYLGAYVPKYSSAEESLRVDAERLFGDLCKVAGRMFAHA